MSNDDTEAKVDALVGEYARLIFEMINQDGWPLYGPGDECDPED